MNGNYDLARLLVAVSKKARRIIIVAIVFAILSFGIVSVPKAIDLIFQTQNSMQQSTDLTFTAIRTIYISLGSDMKNTDVNTDWPDILQDNITSAYLNLLKTDVVINELAQDDEKYMSGSKNVTKAIRNSIAAWRVNPANAAQNSNMVSVRVTTQQEDLSNKMVDSLVDILYDKVSEFEAPHRMNIVERYTVIAEANDPPIIAAPDRQRLAESVKPASELWAFTVTGLTYALIGFLAGLIVAVFFVFLTDSMDLTIKSERDLQDLGIPVLGVISQGRINK